MRHAEGEPHRRFGFEAEVCEHVLHEGLIDQSRTKRVPMACMMQRSVDGGAHEAGRCDGAVESCVMHHLENGAYPASRLANLLPEGAVVLDLR